MFQYQIRTNVCKTIRVNEINVASTQMDRTGARICCNARAAIPRIMMELSALVQS